MVSEKISKEGIKMEVSSVEDGKVFETIEDGLGLFYGGIFLVLNLFHEPEQVFHGHVAIF